MPLFRTLRESCPDKINCPKIRVGPHEDVFVQGYVVTDPVLLTHPDLSPGETVVRIPAAAAAVLLSELTVGMGKISRPGTRVCPNGDVLVRGYVVNAPALLVELDLPPGETIVRIPAAGAADLLPELMMGSASA
jgi:hypothetical protein